VLRDGVGGYVSAFFRGSRNDVRSYATARADALGGRDEDAKRAAAVVEVATGIKPVVRRRSDGKS